MFINLRNHYMILNKLPELGMIEWVATTLFRRTLEKDILVLHIYVDDIIFGSSNASLCKEFSKLMHDEFEMSMMGELKFFLGIQINQSKMGCMFIKQNTLRSFWRSSSLKIVKWWTHQCIVPAPWAYWYNWFFVIPHCIYAKYFIQCVLVCKIPVRS